MAWVSIYFYPPTHPPHLGSPVSAMCRSSPTEESVRCVRPVRPDRAGSSPPARQMGKGG